LNPVSLLALGENGKNRNRVFIVLVNV
jgi:hypothetical protein